MRIVFMGTPEFSVPPLLRLHEAGFEIAAVYTQPPRPAHRGMQLQKSAVHLAAEALGIPVRTPEKLKPEADFLASLQVDAFVVVAYGLILPQIILDIPKLAPLNIHASLLPRWRGAAPIHRAIEAGDSVTGVTIMRMEAGLDTGPMLLRDEIAITADMTTPILHDALSQMGADLIVRALREKPAETIQPQDGASYAAKIQKEEGRIDWSQPAKAIERRIRAFTPWPGCFFEYQGEVIKILKAECVDLAGLAGQVMDHQLTIACGQGGLKPLILQRQGKKALPVAEFLSGFQIPQGILLNI